jgi:hypothetical protein
MMGFTLPSFTVGFKPLELFDLDYINVTFKVKNGIYT